MILQGIRGQVSIEPLVGGSWPRGMSTVVAIGESLDIDALESLVANASSSQITPQ